MKQKAVFCTRGTKSSCESGIARGPREIEGRTFRIEKCRSMCDPQEGVHKGCGARTVPGLYLGSKEKIEQPGMAICGLCRARGQTARYCEILFSVPSEMEGCVSLKAEVRVYIANDRAFKPGHAV